VSRIREKTPEGHPKSIFITPKVKKKTKIHMESIRQSLQAQPNNIKKLSEHQINQSKKKKSQIKVCLVFQNEKKAKIRMGATRWNFQAQPKTLKKIVGTSNQPIRSKIFPKKLCLVPLKCKGAKILYGLLNPKS
jgi:hypothetical protein